MKKRSIFYFFATECASGFHKSLNRKISLLANMIQIEKQRATILFIKNMCHCVKKKTAVQKCTECHSLILVYWRIVINYKYLVRSLKMCIHRNELTIINRIYWTETSRFRFSCIEQVNRCKSLFKARMKFSKKFSALHNAFYVIAFYIIFVCIAKSDACAKHKVIETNNGKVRGVRKTTLIQKMDFYSFKGIPYAKSPIGELRLKVSFFLDFF